MNKDEDSKVSRAIKWAEFTIAGLSYHIENGLINDTYSIDMHDNLVELVDYIKQSEFNKITKDVLKEKTDA